MAKYTYTALNRVKEKQSGELEASDKRMALLSLRSMGLTPLTIVEAQGGAAKKKVASHGFFTLTKPPATRMRASEVLLFTSELADLINAGMTLGAALNTLANQGDPKSGMCVVSADLRDRIMRGEAFSDAVKQHPKTFPPIYGNMVRAGEASGAMVEVLHRLGEHYERSESMRSKIRGAMTYPCIVLALGVVAVIFAMIKIIPKFTDLFKNLGGELPFATRLLMGMSESLTKYGLIYLLGLMVLIVLFRKWKNGPGRYRWDKFKLRVPLIKGLVATGTFASLAYTLQTLLQNGVNVLQALKISEETCGNAVIAAELRKARERVTDGTTISAPLAQSGVFPRMMTDMMALGEQAGNLPETLGHIGKRYETDLNRNIQAFSSALEPILIILVAAVVGFVAIAILSAVFAATSAMGNVG
ncbi:MAG: type II secretion system F family protein [bacterium]|nr:type II secretion system F family protein [bacterium]